MQLVDIDLCAELDYVSKGYRLFSVSDEECLGYKRCILVENLWLQQPVEVCIFILSFRVTSTLKVVRISIVDLLFVLIKDLKFHEVDSLLEQVDVPELLDMQNKFSARSVHNLYLI